MKTVFPSVLSLLVFWFANAGLPYPSIWIEGASFGLDQKDIQHSETIYVTAWDEKAQNLKKKHNASLALQLSKSLNPYLYDGVDLPTLSALAAIPKNEKAVLKEYLVFLEEFSRTKGINYLVLPKLDELSIDERAVLEYARELSPFFYLAREGIGWKFPVTKKEYLESKKRGISIFVVSQETKLKKMLKWEEKFRKAEELEKLQRIFASRDRYFKQVFSFPPMLGEKIQECATYSFKSALPDLGSAKTITYLGENVELRNWLARYTKVSSTRNPNGITVVDFLSMSDTEVKEGDVVLTRERIDLERVSQVVVPFSSGYEVTLAQQLFGAKPIQVVDFDQIQRFDKQYLGYSSPQLEGVSDQFVYQLDSIGSHAIKDLATPGIQIAVVKNGNIIYDRSLGYYSYDSLKPVGKETMYDLASLTKVMATLPALAWLVDRKMISLDDSLGFHLPEFRGSNKSGITVRQLLSHQAGLKSYMPFWSMVLEDDMMDVFYYQTDEDEANDVRTYGYAPHPVMIDTLKSFIKESALIEEPDRYHYSDLGFMLLHLLVEKVSGQPFDSFLAEHFYQPMGLASTMFNPTKQGISLSSIAPTEYDFRYRKGQVWGEVHDRNAVVFGGVAGHSGLFSTATDLAKMMSMFLNDGYYAGRRYLSAETLAEFNFRHFEGNRRGLGWDKKDGLLDAASIYASDSSFGHTGFTGTMAWADPEDDLIFIFLSNRIYPDARNNRLGEFNIRTSMQDAIYQSVAVGKHALFAGQEPGR
ncbi:MAG: serine hydrolase [Bacteroidota bacterium]